MTSPAPTGMADWTRDLPLPDRILFSEDRVFNNTYTTPAIYVGNVRAVRLKALAVLRSMRITLSWEEGGSTQGSLRGEDKFHIFQGDLIDVALRPLGTYVKLLFDAIDPANREYAVDLQAMIDVDLPRGFLADMVPVNQNNANINAGATITLDFPVINNSLAYFRGFCAATAWFMALQSVDYAGTATTLTRTDNTMGLIDTHVWIPAGHGRLVTNNSGAAAALYQAHLVLKPNSGG